ncbi:MAG: hypothetical protein GEU98_07025 [Pseudonocardiaceae bacterium]|nr:hypothetical protein [Pseudonocardiaceae bacterium]
MSTPQGPGQPYGQQYPSAPPPQHGQQYGQQPYGGQQPYQGQQPYGQQQPPGHLPPPPQLSQQELEKPPRPNSVNMSFMFWLIAAGVGIISGILNFALTDSSQLSQGASTGAALFSFALAAAWIATVFAMRAGQNWARILLTILGGIAALLGLVGLAALGALFAMGGLGSVAAIVTIVQPIAIILGIVYMYIGGANYYFKAS